MYGSDEQFANADGSIRTTNFIRNKCVALWIEEGKKPKGERHFGKNEMSALCAVLAKEYEFCRKLNSMARQAAAERAAFSVNRFYENCKNPRIKNKGYPKFKREGRSVEYKTSGWKFLPDCKHIKFTDKTGMGTFALRGGRTITPSVIEAIQRIRIVRKASGYYLQLILKLNDHVELPPTDKAVGLDVGLKEYYVTNLGKTEENPKFLRKSERKLKRLQRKHSRSVKKSNNKSKRKRRLARKHEQVSNQRKDFAAKSARCVVTSNDVVVVEALQIANMVKNHNLAKAISDASWGVFLATLERASKKYGKIYMKVNPANTSQACSCCGCLPTVKLTLADRVYNCEHCGLILDRDINAAINILRAALALAKAELSKATAGYVGSWSWVCNCLEKAIVESELQYVFGDLASMPPASDGGVRRVGEEETSQDSLSSTGSRFFKESKECERLSMGIPRLKAHLR